MRFIPKNFCAEQLRRIFLYLLFFSMPFSIAGDDFSIIFLYGITIYLFVKKREQWTSHAIQYGMLFFLLGAILSSILSNDPLLSFSYFRSFWRLGLPFLVFFTLKDQKPESYMKLLLLISSIIGIYAIVQSFTGLDVLRSASLQSGYQPEYNGRWLAVGVFSHHLTFGGVTLLIFSLLTPLAFVRQLGIKLRILFAFGALLNLVALVLTLGRSNWLGSILSMGIMTIFLLPRKVMISLLLLVTVGGSTFWFTENPAKEHFLNSTSIGKRIAGGITIHSNKDRLFMWEAGLKVIRDNPIFGIGPRMGEEVVPYYHEIAKREGHHFQHHPSVGLHNLYLQTWMDFGLIGILGYLAWWFTLFAQIINRLRKKTTEWTLENSLLLGSLAGLAGSMVAASFENNFRDGEVQTIILVTMGIALTCLRKKETK